MADRICEYPGVYVLSGLRLHRASHRVRPLWASVVGSTDFPHNPPATLPYVPMLLHMARRYVHRQHRHKRLILTIQPPLLFAPVDRSALPLAHAAQEPHHADHRLSAKPRTCSISLSARSALPPPCCCSRVISVASKSSCLSCWSARSRCRSSRWIKFCTCTCSDSTCSCRRVICSSNCALSAMPSSSSAILTLRIIPDVSR